MPGEPLRFATARRYDVHVDVASIVCAKSDPFAIWREVRIGALPLETAEPPGCPASALDDPDVAAIRESDVGRADGGRAEELCVGIHSWQAEGCAENEDQGKQSHGDKDNSTPCDGCLDEAVTGFQ